MQDSYHQMSDESLVSLVRAGNHQAEGELISRFLPMIRRQASRYSLPGMEPDDLTQEGLIGFIKALRVYRDGENPFAALASRCIASSLADAARRALSGKNRPLNDCTQLDTETDQILPSGSAAAQASNPEHLVLERMAADELYRTIRMKLSPRERQVLSYYLAGKSYGEIANALSTSPKSVDNTIQRIRRKLRPA